MGRQPRRRPQLPHHPQRRQSTRLLPARVRPREYQQSWFNGNTTYSSFVTVWTNHWSYISQNNIAPIWLGEFGTTNNASDIHSNSAGGQGQYFQSLIQHLASDPSLNWTYWALNGEDAYGLLDSIYDSPLASNLKQQSLASIQFQFGAGSSGGGTTPPPSSGPASPTNVTATAASSSQVNLAWQASTSPNVTYTVYASTTSGFSASSSNYVASDITASNYAVTGLAASTTWYFIVQSVQNGNGGDYTARASAATPAAASTPPPPSSSSCHVAYTDQNDWGSGMTGALTITNTDSAPITHWTLTWAYAGNQ